MLRTESARFGQGILFMSLEGVRSLITVVVYLILMPLMVFFFLKDKHLILGWFVQFLPRERSLTSRIWTDVDAQIGNYVRGKVWEILLVWVASYVTFTWLELDYAMLLSLFVGLSVLVPYIGATVMTLPVAVIAYFDYGGINRQFIYAVGAYGVLQLLDGNLLAPLLLSEVVNLHPVAIIVAVLVFGGLWGFWGVFFAIPLATVVQAIIKAWPRRSREPEPPPEPEPPAESPSATPA
jgi:putative permease